MGVRMGCAWGCMPCVGKMCLHTSPPPGQIFQSGLIASFVILAADVSPQMIMIAFLVDMSVEGRLAWKVWFCTMSSCMCETSSGVVSTTPLDTSRKKICVLTSMMQRYLCCKHVVVAQYVYVRVLILFDVEETAVQSVHCKGHVTQEEGKDVDACRKQGLISPLYRLIITIQVNP